MSFANLLFALYSEVMNENLSFLQLIELLGVSVSSLRVSIIVVAVPHKMQSQDGRDLTGADRNTCRYVQNLKLLSFNMPKR